MPRPQRNTRRLLAAAARGLERRAELLRLSRRSGLGLGRLRGVGGRLFVGRSFLRGSSFIGRGLLGGSSFIGRRLSLLSACLLRGRGLVGLGLGRGGGLVGRGLLRGGGLLRGCGSLLLGRVLASASLERGGLALRR